MGDVPLDLLFVKKEGLGADVTEIVLGIAITDYEVFDSSRCKFFKNWIIQTATLTSGGQNLASLEDWL